MDGIVRDGRRTGEVLRRNPVKLPSGEELEYLTFPSLEETGLVRHLISTRLGGVSRGEYASMNLSFTRGDREEDVRENYRRIGRALGCAPEDMILSAQAHTVNIRRVGAADRGKGVTRESDYSQVDGLITDEPGIALVTQYADCVPLLFLDPVRKAIGCAHSGWRGTVKGMGERMIQAMGEAFGTRPGDLLCAIGPSICRDCYEVGEDVAEGFRRLEAETEEQRRRLALSGRYGNAPGGSRETPSVLTPGKREGKFQLDLWLANYLILCRGGVTPEKIAITDLCTCHNSGYLFSHRASGGRRGGMGVFLMLDTGRTKAV